MSGPFANTGEAVLRNLVWAVERVNSRGGVTTLEGKRNLVLNRYDSKGQSEEALTSLRTAIDSGAQFVLQGNSSANAAALMDAIQKHNEREPPKASALFKLRSGRSCAHARKMQFLAL
jgi:branched-chain amino acid transport system substrate-binding protein